MRVFYGLLCAVMLCSVLSTFAQAQSFATRHTRPAVTSGEAKFLNRLPGTQTMNIDIVLPLRDPEGLDKFLAEVYDPSSPVYRHFLTPEEFTARFGPSRGDFNAVIQYAESFGFKVLGATFEGRDIQLEGSVTSVEAAFNVSMGLYQHPTENRSFYAPDREPTVRLPMQLWHVSGLDNYSLPHPALVHHDANAAAKPAATTGSGPSQSFLGSDMRAAYYGGALTGTGQYVGLLEYYGTDLVDLTNYYTNVGQTNNVTITLVSVGGASTSCVYSKGCDDTEQTLDMTQALGMAPGLSGLYMFVGNTDTAMFSSMATTKPSGSVIANLSSSWTWSPADPSSAEPYFKQFAAQGQNYFQAAGDGGSWTSRSEIYPADDPYVTSVGGTDLTTSSAAGPWASETVWSDGGGGISPNKLAIPSWQQLAGVITSTNKGSTTYRNGPDVSANANFTFYVCADQTTCTANEYGGTSFATPMWAGYLALANQQLYSTNGTTFGFINPTLYALGLAEDTTVFHDITSGSNGSYSATAGYDLASGWGSPNGPALISAMVAAVTVPTFTVSASPSSVTVAQGNQGSSTVSVTFLNGLADTVDLTATGQPTGVTVSFTPSQFTASGTSSMGISVSSTAAGTYTITVTGTDQTTGKTATSTVMLTVTAPDFSLSASRTSLSINQGSSSTSTISAKALNGFSSSTSISLSASGQPSGVTVTFATNPITTATTSKMTVKVSSTASTGTSTITITGTGGGKTHTTTVSLTIRR
jgi:kumamolisin